MTELPETSYVIEGELVRDVWDYEYDDLMIGGADLKAWIDQQLGGRVEEASHTTRKTHYGRVRLTLEVLE